MPSGASAFRGAGAVIALLIPSPSNRLLGIHQSSKQGRFVSSYKRDFNQIGPWI